MTNRFIILTDHYLASAILEMDTLNPLRHIVWIGFAGWHSKGISRPDIPVKPVSTRALLQEAEEEW